MFHRNFRRIGVDWGSQTIKVALAGGAGQGRQFTGGWLPLTGQISPEPVAADAATGVLGPLLEQLCQGSGLSCRRSQAVVALPSAQTLARSVYLPRLSRRELRASLHLELERLLTFPVAEAVGDYIPLAARPGAGEPGTEQGFLLLAAAEREVADRAASLRRAGLRVAAVEPEPVTLVRLARLLAPPGGPGSQVLIDLGASGTRLVILRDGDLVLFRNISVGGRQLTAALAEFLGCSLEEAEARKVTDFQASRDLGAFGLAGERLLSELGRSLRFVEREYRLSGYAGLYLVGGGAHWPALRRMVAETVGVPAREPVLTPFRSLDPVMSQAVALALWGQSGEASGDRGREAGGSGGRWQAGAGVDTAGGVSMASSPGVSMASSPGVSMASSPGVSMASGSGSGVANGPGGSGWAGTDRPAQGPERRDSGGNSESAPAPAPGQGDGTAPADSLGWGRPLRPLSGQPGHVWLAAGAAGPARRAGDREQ